MKMQGLQWWCERGTKLFPTQELMCYYVACTINKQTYGCGRFHSTFSLTIFCSSIYPSIHPPIHPPINRPSIFILLVPCSNFQSLNLNPVSKHQNIKYSTLYRTEKMFSAASRFALRRAATTTTAFRTNVVQFQQPMFARNFAGASVSADYSVHYTSCFVLF